MYIYICICIYLFLKDYLAVRFTVLEDNSGVIDQSENSHLREIAACVSHLVFVSKVDICDKFESINLCAIGIWVQRSC